MMYYLIALIPYAVQLFLIIHIIRNHKPYYWLFIILFLPYIGGIAYLLIELIPSMARSRTSRKLGKTISTAINPMGEVNKLRTQVEMQDTVSNRILLANAYAQAGMYTDAVDWYKKCLTGPYENDSTILFPLASAYYHDNQITEAREIMENLKKEKPFTMQEEQLLYILIRQADGEDVFGELAALYDRAHNFETGYYYVQALIERGDRETAEKIVEDMKETLKNYRNFRDTMGREWVSRSEKALHRE